jgi:hypothetical protein
VECRWWSWADTGAQRVRQQLSPTRVAEHGDPALLPIGRPVRGAEPAGR